MARADRARAESGPDYTAGAMNVCRTRVRRFAWLAILALLALALAPTISRLLANPRLPPELAAVCGPDGLRALDTAGDRGSGSGTTLGHLEACAYCGPAFAALVPPALVPAWHAMPIAREPSPDAADLPAFASSIWTAALPRAPPARA